jgi:uncharacterized protein
MLSTLSMNGYQDIHVADYPVEYLRGIDLFNSGSYWHAHEAWEEVWRNSQGDRKLFYQGLIQAAAALLHYDRNNLLGTRLCMNNALKKLEALRPIYLSLDLSEFTATLRDFVADALIEQPDERHAVGKNVAQPHPKIALIDISVVEAV